MCYDALGAVVTHTNITQSVLKEICSAQWEAMISQTLQLVSTPVCLVSSDGKILCANPPFCKEVSIHPPAKGQLDFESIVEPQDRKEVAELLYAICEHKPILEKYDWSIRKNGLETKLSFIAQATYSDQGTACCLFQIRPNPA